MNVQLVVAAIDAGDARVFAKKIGGGLGVADDLHVNHAAGAGAGDQFVDRADDKQFAALPLWRK